MRTRALHPAASSPRRGALGLLVAALTGLAACASGAGDGGDAGGAPRDMALAEGGPRDASRDAADDAASPVDMGPADPCRGVVCMGFEVCERGTCVPYDACTPAGGCPDPADLCRARYCVPRDRDIDGDGVTAATDCDETNPAIAPGRPEVCNALDDDCSGGTDDAAPSVLCAPGEGICLSGACGCPPGQFDLDARADTGCECAAVPADGVAADCAGAQDLGELADTGQMQLVTGNALPAAREVWYRFRGVDTADTSCDALHVRVQFLMNPDSAFEFTVFRGGCGVLPMGCADTGYQDFSFFTDFLSGTGPGSTGECPCAPSPVPGANVCGDQSADYFVRVRRKPSAPLACAGYIVELSNGVY